MLGSFSFKHKKKNKNKNTGLEKHSALNQKRTPFIYWSTLTYFLSLSPYKNDS